MLRLYAPMKMTVHKEVLEGPLQESEISTQLIHTFNLATHNATLLLARDQQHIHDTRVFSILADRYLPTRLGNHWQSLVVLLCPSIHGLSGPFIAELWLVPTRSYHFLRSLRKGINFMQELSRARWWFGRFRVHFGLHDANTILYDRAT